MSDRSEGKRKQPGTKGILRARREAKRAAAEERQARYAALTLSEKLALIEGRPGASARERARLEGGS